MGILVTVLRKAFKKQLNILSIKVGFLVGEMNIHRLNYL